MTPDNTPASVAVVPLADPHRMKWADLRSAIWHRVKDDEREDEDLCFSRAEMLSVLEWAERFDRQAQPRRDEEEATFAMIKRGRELIEPADGEAVFYLRVGGENSHLTTKAKSIEPDRALQLAIEALCAEAKDAENCPVHRLAFQQPTEELCTGLPASADSSTPATSSLNVATVIALLESDEAIPTEAICRLYPKLKELAFQQPGGEAEPLHFEDHPIGKAILAVRHRAASNFAPEFSGQRGQDFDRGLLSAFEAANRARQIEAQKRPAPDAALRSALEKCRDQFAFYAVEHRKKAGNFAMMHGAHSPECLGAQEKAVTNDCMADLCDKALAATPSQKQGEGL